MKATLPALKHRLKALRSYWCELQEPIVATLKNDILLDYGVERGFSKLRMAGQWAKIVYIIIFPPKKELILETK